MDAPARHGKGWKSHLEDGISEATASALEAKGHRLRRENEPVNQVGGGQAIYFDRDEDGLLGASDRRKDGCSIGY
jgi:gamma-glutamyltranspeptidase/glutathione hydrolase